MPFRTTAFDAAAELGWSMAEVSERSGVPVFTLYGVKRGYRAPGPRTIAGLRRAFPHLSFEQLFVPDDSTNAQAISAIAEPIRPEPPAPVEAAAA